MGHVSDSVAGFEYAESLHRPEMLSAVAQGGLHWSETSENVEEDVVLSVSLLCSCVLSGAL